MSKLPITHCEHGIDRAYRCIDCVEAERDALRAWAQELEAENLALQNVLSSQQRAPSLEKLVADLRRTELESLRARVEELEAENLKLRIGFSDMRGAARFQRSALKSLRASIAALADEWDAMAKRQRDQAEWDARRDHSYSATSKDGRAIGYEECARELRQLTEGNSAAAQEGL